MGTVLLRSFTLVSASCLVISILTLLRISLNDSMLEWESKARPTVMQLLERFQDAKLIKDMVNHRFKYSPLRAKAAQLLHEQSTFSAT